MVPKDTGMGTPMWDISMLGLLERDSLDTMGVPLCGRYICRRGKGFLRYYDPGVGYIWFTPY